MLFRKKMPPKCASCERAVPMEGQNMLCRRYGIVHEAYHCRKFIYDPLKRRPQRAPSVDFDPPKEYPSLD